MLAARTGQLLNTSTLQGWISVLEQNHVVGVLRPYHSNLSKRLVKAPKFYFLETSLATRLQGWTQLEPLLKSPAAGALFETLVYGEIMRTLDHGGGGNATLWHLRTRDGDEVDFLLQGPDARWLLIEAKLGVQSAQPVRLSGELMKVVPPGTPAWVVTASGDPQSLSEYCLRLPLSALADHLERWLAHS